MPPKQPTLMLFITLNCRVFPEEIWGWPASIPDNPHLMFLRKEVIQPQVPLRLPCYDFIPVTAHSVGRCFLTVSSRTSATNDFHDVTGGVYKARERIHGAVADAPLLAIPAS